MKRKKSILIILATLTTLSGSALAREAKHASLDFFAAEYQTSGGAKAKAKDTKSEGLFFLSDKPIGSLNDVTYSLHEDGELTIDLAIGKDAAEKINRLVAGYPEKRLALSMDGEVLASLRVAEPIKGEKIQLSFRDRASFDKVVQALKELKKS